MANTPRWIEKLRQRWGVKSGWQVLLILIVFALTGSTIARIRKPLLELIFPDQDIAIWIHIVSWVAILPLYNVILLIYGFIFGQFKFFWEFEKRMFRRIIGKK